MSDRVFCIDFGSTFTKVGLRTNPRQATRLVRHPSLTLDGELQVCVPTTAVLDSSGLFPGVICGEAALDRVSGSGLQVYSNWKRQLLTSGLDPRPLPAPETDGLDDLFRSSELRQLAERFGVSVEQLQALHPSGRGTAAPVAVVAPPRSDSDTQTVAVGFFRWLHEFVLEACQFFGVPRPEEIPVRITVPAFTRDSDPRSSPASRRLRDVLQQAGWPLDRERDVVSEPYANAIGVLTRGANAIWEANGRELLHMGQMFGQGALVEAIRAGREHRVIVADVGSYTTDFAALEFPAGGDPDAPPCVTDYSVPQGVGNLDQRVLSVLTTDQARRMRDNVPAIDWEDFRRAVYSASKPFSTGSVGRIGHGASGEAIRGQIAEFAAELARHATEFRESLDYGGQPDEVILTGGGNNIPAVQQALMTALAGAGQNRCRVHATGQQVPACLNVQRFTIQADMSRGATAIGGPSVFFDVSFH